MNGVLNYIINMQNGTFGRGVSESISQVDKLDRMVNRVGVSIAAAFSIDKALSITHETTDMAASFQLMENRINAASKTQVDFQKNNAMIKTAITDLKLPLMETTEAYGLYLSSIKNTVLEGERGNDTFMNMSVGAKAAGLDTERLSRGFNALNKMISTGNVQADEFKGMLAEAIPGAMDIARKAMNFNTIAEFNKEMEKGNINSIEFVQKFSEEFRKAYQDKLPAALQTYSSQITDNQNKLLQRKITIGEELMPVELQWLNLQLLGYDILSKALNIYKENATLINALAVAVIGGAVAYYAMIVANKAYATWQAITYAWGILQLGIAEANTLGLTGWAAAQHALNIAMAANPIGLIIVGIGALIGLLAMAWNESENFRATMMGVWEVMKSLFELWVRFITMPLRLVLDPGSVVDNIREMKKLALGLGDDYTRGRANEFAEGIKAKKTPVDSPAFKLPKTLTSGADGNGAGGKNTTTTGRSSESGKGGNQVKNITINISRAIGEAKITVANAQQLTNSELKKIVADVIIAAAHDAEVMIANN